MANADILRCGNDTEYKFSKKWNHPNKQSYQGTLKKVLLKNPD